MRYLSVCSGIEAASVAWGPIGFHAVGFSEIDKFPAAVLRARFPQVQNYGDINGFEGWDLEAIDLLVGGTPCQSFSVAGLRKGLDDERGNLALVYCRILERFRPKWFVWENVPGVLSSGRGRDFGAFLGAVAKLGYGFAYRVLDAQFFGVPQRRRRVFVIGCFGDWRSAAAVLFERESLSRDSTKGRGSKQKVARTLRARANSSHREDSNNFVAHACLAKGGTERLDPSCKTFISCTLSASNGGVSSGMHPIIAFDCRAGGQTGLSIDGTPGALRCHNGGHAAILEALQVRRLTPMECERLQGFPDDWTAIEYGPTKTKLEEDYLRYLLRSGKLSKEECFGRASDGPRYKAIGNSMAVPVMRWIGERLMSVICHQGAGTD